MNFAEEIREYAWEQCWLETFNQVVTHNRERIVVRYRFYSECGKGIEVVRAMDDRDVLPSREELDEEGMSDMSPYEFSRRLETPVISKRHIPATGQGSRYTRDPIMRDMREVNKLEQESYNLPEEKRGPINAEIAKIEGKT